MASQQELAVIYAALALQDDDKAITVEDINKLLSAANVSVEPFWVGLYVNALKGVNVKDLIQKIGSGVGSAPSAAAAAPAAAAAAAPAKEEKKKEAAKEESEDEDMGFGLFD